MHCSVLSVHSSASGLLGTYTLLYVDMETTTGRNLQLLTNGSARLCGSRVLQFDRLDQLWKTSQVVFFIFLGGQAVDQHADGGEWFLLFVQWA